MLGKRLVIGLLTIAMGAAACGGGEDTNDACASDNDCKGDRVCDGGECVNPGQSPSTTNDSTTDPTPSSSTRNSTPNKPPNDAAMCQDSSDCPSVVCPCRDGDLDLQSCTHGSCATLSACATECSDLGGLKMDTDCNGDFSLGSTPFVSGENVIGNECDGVPPQNCIDGTFIQVDGGCICTPMCESAVGIGGNCTDDGAWTCQRVESSNGNNSAAICVHESWNLCGPG